MPVTVYVAASGVVTFFHVKAEREHNTWQRILLVRAVLAHPAWLRCGALVLEKGQEPFFFFAGVAHIFVAHSIVYLIRVYGLAPEKHVCQPVAVHVYYGDTIAEL